MNDYKLNPIAQQAISDIESKLSPVKEKSLLTDTANAEKIVELYGEKLRFDHKRKRWLIWCNHIWKPDRDGEIARYAILAAKQRHKDATEISDIDECRRVSAWAISSQSRVKLEAAIALTRSLKPIADNGENWDTDTMLLSCKNGIIDLRTGTLREGLPNDRITMSTGVNYNPDAACDRWEQFLNEVFEGNDELIHYVQKALGYSLTGSTREQVVFFCFGSGSNGKSVLFSTIKSLLKDYAYNAPASMLQRTKSDATNDVAATEFKRFLVSSETLSSTKINEQRLKKWSGGDEETARYLYAEYFTFQPTVKVWLFVNHKPVVEDDSYGFWRRVRLIPFNRTFSGDDIDPMLTQKLKEESEGIFAWLVRGCLLWQKEGLNHTPAIVEAETKNYQAENDEIAEFIFDKCIEGEALEVKASDIYSAYVTWAEGQNMKNRDILLRTSFGRRMGDKFKRKAKKNGKYYVGIDIKGDGFEDPSSHEVTGSTPISRNYSIQPSRREFSENNPKPVTQPQKPVTQETIEYYSDLAEQTI